MATTDFGRMSDYKKIAWSMKFWKNARNASFLTRLLGKGADSVVQRITELSKTQKGTRAIITLIPDDDGDGVAGDRTLKGNEDALSKVQQEINVDQLRKAHKSAGRISEQASIVTFRREAVDQLGYWIGDRVDQMAILTLSGVSYAYKNNGAARTGSDLPYLAFGDDVTAPSTNRHRRWTGNSTGLKAGGTTETDMAVPTYQMLLALKAFAQDEYLKPVRGEMGKELYHVFMTPQGMYHLKLDTVFHAAIRDAMPRTPKSPLFTGFDTIYVDGMAIHTHRHVYNTSGAASGSKWGSGAAQDGQRVIFAGAQALGFADLGKPYWVEEDDDYENQMGISLGKIFGFKKPVFPSVRTGTDEDFGVIVCDTLI